MSLSEPPNSRNKTAFNLDQSSSRTRFGLSSTLGSTRSAYTYLERTRTGPSFWRNYFSLNAQEQQESEKVASELKGNTLRVYWYVMNAKEQTVGVREVQRALNFSSPTLALYHLDKLKDLGLVSKDTGEYRLIKEVKVDVLKQFLRLGRVFVPRFALYAALFTVLFVYYVLIIPDLNLFTFFGIIFGGLGSAIFWFETWKAWKQQS